MFTWKFKPKVFNNIMLNKCTEAAHAASSAFVDTSVGGCLQEPLSLWVGVMALDTEVLRVSFSNELPEAALWDTSRRQAAGPLATRLSAWGQSAWEFKVKVWSFWWQWILKLLPSVLNLRLISISWFKSRPESEKDFFLIVALFQNNMVSQLSQITHVHLCVTRN